MVDIVLSRFEFNLRACFSSNLLQNLKTPGPGQYAPEMVDAVFRKAPSYSLSARTTGNLTQSSPGPAAYVLSEQIGSNVKTKTSAPAYSMSSRYGSFSEGMAIFCFDFWPFSDLKKTPGPGTYNTIDPSIYRYRQHVYSMTGRNLQPGDTTKKPGPGAHRQVVKFLDFLAQIWFLPTF